MEQDSSSLLWKEEDKGVRIIGIQGSPDRLEIPDTIQGKPVTVIGSGCFFLQDRLESVVLPDTVTEIGTQAFAMCPRLCRLRLPDSLKRIGPFAFRDSPLHRLTVPAGVEVLDACTFSYCQSLRQVILQEGLREIRSHAFYMTRVGTEEPLVLPSSVRIIHPGAFYAGIGSIRIETDLVQDPAWFSAGN